MKATGIVIIAVVALAMVFIAGCTSQAPKYEDPDAALKASIAAAELKQIAEAKAEATVHIESFESKDGKYGSVEVTGIIHNGKSTDAKVFGYVDFYQNGVKVDDAIFSCAPDAHGKATFKATTHEVVGKYNYEIRISSVYKA